MRETKRLRETFKYIFNHQKKISNFWLLLFFALQLKKCLRPYQF